MQIIEELSDFSPKQDTLLTIGVFDGVHRGHQHVIGQLKHKAVEKGLLAGVVTFKRHPLEVLNPERNITYLTTLEERLSLIRALGIEIVVALTFTSELSRLSAREFVVLLQRYLRMKGLLIGPDFTLGRERNGNASTLAALGKELQFSVDTVSPLKSEQQVISSTAIREALTRGEMRSATKLLGRYFSLSGTIIPGNERGRILGFPTANIGVNENRTFPSDGVYATWAHVNDQVYHAVVNIGFRPTFGNGKRTVEVYLFNFVGSLYGSYMTIDLVDKIRSEMKFSSAIALSEQIKKDIEQAQTILAREGKEE